MAKRSNQKLKLLYLSKILTENTDERHGLTLSQIIDRLRAYGIDAGRKSLYDDMEALRVYGIDVRTKRDRYVRYYVHDKKFDVAEIRLLSDMILNSPFITEKKSREIIKKIQALGGVPQGVETISSIKAYSDDVYNNINVISKAIASENKLMFRCFEWNSKKQRILVANGEFFKVVPHRLVFENKKYILQATDIVSKHPISFNVERIINISMLGKISAKENNAPSEATEESYNVRLRCNNSAAGDIFDRFGIGVTILSNRDDYFDISVKAELDAEFFAWLFTMRGKITLLSSEEAARRYKEALVYALNSTEKINDEEER